MVTLVGDSNKAPTVRAPSVLSILSTVLLTFPAAAQELAKAYVKVSPSTSGSVVSWPAVPTATGYKIDRAKENDTCCNRSWTVGAATTSSADALSSNGVYQYTVTANLSNGLKVSAQATLFYQWAFEPVARPTALTVVTACTPAQQTAGYPPGSVTIAGGPTAQSVMWTAASEASAYLVERGYGTSPTTWTSLGCLPATQTWLDESTRSDLSKDQTIWPGETYKYKVTAFTATGAAGWNSGTVTMPLLTPPSNLTMTRTGNSVYLCWNYPRGHYAGPKRSRITTSYGSDFTLATNTVAMGAGQTCYTLLGLPMGTSTIGISVLYYATPTMLESTRTTQSVSVMP